MKSKDQNKCRRHTPWFKHLAQDYPEYILKDDSPVGFSLVLFNWLSGLDLRLKALHMKQTAPIKNLETELKTRTRHHTKQANSHLIDSISMAS